MLVIVTVISLTVVACDILGGSEPNDDSTLRIPPCQTTRDALRDPCARQPFHSIESGNSTGSYGPPQTEDFSMQNLMAPQGYPPEFLPRVVVRGVVIPGTTRCGAYPFNLARHNPDANLHWEGLTIHCFVDVDARHYILGSGPRRITISAHYETYAGNIDWAFDSNYEYDPRKYLKDESNQLRKTTVAQFEGGEWIFFLRTTVFDFLEAWRARTYWDVQRDENNAVLAVSPAKEYLTEYVELESAHGDNAEAERVRKFLPFTEYLLSDFERQITEVAASRPVLASNTQLTDIAQIHSYFKNERGDYADLTATPALPIPISGEIGRTPEPSPKPIPAGTLTPTQPPTDTPTPTPTPSPSTNTTPPSLPRS